MRRLLLAVSGFAALSAGCKVGEPPPPTGVVAREVGRVEILPVGPTRVLTLPVGTSAVLNARVLDTRGNPFKPTLAVIFVSRDSSVARVSSGGSVTAVGIGSTFVEAEVPLGGYLVYPDSVAVNVVMPEASK